MLKSSIIVAALLVGPAYAHAQDHKDWCTDAHMQQMDSKVAKMTGTKMQDSAKMHLDAAKAEMKKNNTEECIKHMEEAHKAMGM
jgi:hypothetical protein